MSEINNLPLIDVSNSETGCCPVFDPEPWEGKVFELKDMLFAKAETKSIMYIPINMDKIFTKTQALIDEALANLETGYLILSKDVSKRKSEHYFRVSKNVPGLEMVTLSGTFITKVYDGKYNEMRNFFKRFNKYATDEGYEIKEIFVFYTTCPKCAEYYGHNYMVFFGRI